MKNKRIFGLFKCILKPLLTALVLCITANNVFGATCTTTSTCDCSPALPDGTTNKWSQVNGNLVPAASNLKGPFNVWYFHRLVNNGNTPSISFVLTSPGTYYVHYGDCTTSTVRTSACKWIKIEQGNKTPTVYTYTVPGNHDNVGTGLKKMEFYRSGSPATGSYNTYWPVMSFSSYFYTSSTTDYCGYNFQYANTTTVSISLLSYTFHTIAGVGGSIGAVFPAVGDGAGNQPLFKGMFAGTGLGCYGVLDSSSDIPAVPPSNFFSGVTDKAYTLAPKQFAYMFYDCMCLGRAQSGGSAGTLQAGWFSDSNLKCGVNDLFKYMFRVDNSNWGWVQYINHIAQ